MSTLPILRSSSAPVKTPSADSSRSKLSEAIDRLELLYWDCHWNGGPDREVLCILRLCEEAKKDGDDEDHYELAPESASLPLLKI